MEVRTREKGMKVSWNKTEYVCVNERGWRNGAATCVEVVRWMSLNTWCQLSTVIEDVVER